MFKRFAALALFLISIVCASPARAQLRFAQGTEVTNTSTQAFQLGLPAPPSIVYAPGGTRGGNVYTTWSQVDQVAKSFSGDWTLYFDGTNTSGVVTIPAGAWTLAQGGHWVSFAQLDGGVSDAGVLASSVTRVVLASGTTFTWPPKSIRDVWVLNENTSGSRVFTNPVASLSLYGGAVLDNSTVPSIPMFSLGGSFNQYEDVIDLHDYSIMTAPLANAIFTDGDVTGQTLLFMHDSSSTRFAFDSSVFGNVYPDFNASVYEFRATFNYISNFPIASAGVAVVVSSVSTGAQPNVFSNMLAACNFLVENDVLPPTGGTILFDVTSYTMSSTEEQFCFGNDGNAMGAITLRGVYGGNGNQLSAPSGDVGRPTTIYVPNTDDYLESQGSPIAELDNVKLVLNYNWDGGAPSSSVQAAIAYTNNSWQGSGFYPFQARLILTHGSSIVQMPFAPSTQTGIAVIGGSLSVYLDDTSSLTNLSDASTLFYGDGSVSIVAFGASQIGANMGGSAISTSYIAGSPAAVFDPSISPTLWSNASEVAYNGATSHLSATTVQGAIDQIAATSFDGGAVTWGGALTGSSNSAQYPYALLGPGGDGGITTVGSTEFLWSPSFGINLEETTQTSDVATHGVLIKSQAPFASATTNKTPGPIMLDIPAPLTGATHGAIQLQDSETTWLSMTNATATVAIDFSTAAHDPSIGQDVTSSANGGLMTVTAQGTVLDSGAQGGELLVSGGFANCSTCEAGVAALVGGGSTLGTAGAGIVAGGTGKIPGSGELIGGNGLGAGAAGGNTLLSTGTPGSGGANGIQIFQINSSQGWTFSQPTSTAAQISFDPTYTSGTIIGYQTNTSGTTAGGIELIAQSSTNASGLGGSVFLVSGGGLTSGDIELSDNGTDALLVNGATNVTELLYPACFGSGTYAASGLMRIPYGVSTTILAERNSGNTADLSVLSTDSSNNLRVGDSSNSLTSVRGTSVELIGGGSSSVGIGPSGGAFVTSSAGQDIDMTSGSNQVFRIDGTNLQSKITGSLLGDETANDPLSFGIASVSLAGATSNVTLTNTQYQNFDIQFTGTPGSGSSFVIVLPSTAGYSKILDFQGTNLSATPLLAIGVGTLAYPKSCQVPTGGTTGPKMLASWNGTSLNCDLIGVPVTGSSFSSGSVSLATSSQTSVLGGAQSVTVNGGSGKLSLDFDVNIQCVTSISMTAYIYVDGSQVGATDTIAMAAASTTVVVPYHHSWMTPFLSHGAHTYDLKFNPGSLTCTATNVFVRSSILEN